MRTKESNTMKRTLDLKKPPVLSAEQKTRLDSVAAMPDEQIDYKELPGLFALCQHLRALEMAGKQAGLLFWVGPGRVSGWFELHRDNAFRVFNLPACIEYRYVSARDDHGDPDDHQSLTCKDCGSVLSASGSTTWPGEAA